MSDEKRADFEGRLSLPIVTEGHIKVLPPANERTGPGWDVPITVILASPVMRSLTYEQAAGRCVRVPVLEGKTRDTAETLAFDVDSLLDGKEDDGLAEILVPVRNFLKQLAGL